MNRLQYADFLRDIAVVKYHYYIVDYPNTVSLREASEKEVKKSKGNIRKALCESL